MKRHASACAARLESVPACAPQLLRQLMAEQLLRTDHPDEPLDCSLPQYAFTRSEKQLLKTCMNAATSAGMAVGLQGATTGLLGECCCLP